MAKVRTILRVRGFTMVELIIVIVIASILAALALSPKLDLQPTTLDTETKRLLGDVRYVQALSMFSNSRYRLDFSQAGYYRILDNMGSAISYYPASGTQIHLDSESSLSTNSSSKYLVFNGLGVPYASASSSGAGSATSSDYVITITNNSGSETVTIRPETGSSYST
jgi:prepilin-type N-terminal cleavage/methylation domain-containing protein